MVNGSHENFLVFQDAKMVSEIKDEGLYNLFPIRKFIEHQSSKIQYKPETTYFIDQQKKISYTSYIEKILSD